MAVASGQDLLDVEMQIRTRGQIDRRVLHPDRVEGRTPAALVVARQLQVVALALHADGDPADPGP
jgi:hypothetical protein